MSSSMRSSSPPPPPPPPAEAENDAIRTTPKRLSPFFLHRRTPLSSSRKRQQHEQMASLLRNDRDVEFGEEGGGERGSPRDLCGRSSSMIDLSASPHRRQRAQAPQPGSSHSSSSVQQATIRRRPSVDMPSVYASSSPSVSSSAAAVRASSPNIPKVKLIRRLTGTGVAASQLRQSSFPTTTPVTTTPDRRTSTQHNNNIGSAATTSLLEYSVSHCSTPNRPTTPTIPFQTPLGRRATSWCPSSAATAANGVTMEDVVHDGYERFTTPEHPSSPRRRSRIRRATSSTGSTGSGAGKKKNTPGFRCRAACDLPINKDTLLCWVVLVACCSGLVIGFLFLLVQSEGGRAAVMLKTTKRGTLYSPDILSRLHAPPWTVSKQMKVTAFYNVFIAASDSFLAGVDRLIVEEQLGQVGTSFAASGGDLVVYYTSIGEPMDQDWIESLCSYKYNMTCTQTQHYNKANEDVTLTSLHQHCQTRPEESVVYLHNKGSLHPNNKGQDRWRRTMTAAATSQLCLEPANDQCNACGMLFQPLPAPHFPGNIFAARCSYINQLLSPNDFHARNAVTDAWIQSEMEVGLIQNKFSGLFAMEAHYIGKRRYESEVWVGSHPDLRPCDVSVEPNKDYWLEEDRDFALEFRFDMAPRHSLSANWLWWSYTSHNETLTDPAARLRDYFLLRGILYRSLAFYGRIPGRNSYIWWWFPDSDMWRIAIDKYGVAVAINALVQLPGAAKFEYPAPSLLQSWWTKIKSPMRASNKAVGHRTEDGEKQ